MALDIRDQETDIWVWDFARETLERVTTDPGVDEAPVWMPDGRRVVFSSQAGAGAGTLFWQAADGTGTAELLSADFERSAPFGGLKGRHHLCSRKVSGSTGSSTS